jgi:hypothetical protein
MRARAGSSLRPHQVRCIAVIGWPSDLAAAFPLSKGASYTFSYQVSTTTTLSYFEAKISGTTGGGGTDFDVTTDVPTNSPQAFTHTFAATGDPAAGIAFNIMVGGLQTVTVCFEYVSVLKN